jgi:hypothetical protein
VDDELVDVLRAILVKIPGNVTKDKEDKELDLFSIAYNNRDLLINGITNAAYASDSETFFYYNIAPKLQVHELVDNEKVTGAKYRRSFLNKKGQAFFAAIEKRILRKKGKESQSAKSSQDKAKNAQGIDMSPAVEVDTVAIVEAANDRKKEKE